jgi:hypothetical protein
MLGEHHPVWRRREGGRPLKSRWGKIPVPGGKETGQNPGGRCARRILGVASSKEGGVLSPPASSIILYLGGL